MDRRVAFQPIRTISDHPLLVGEILRRSALRDIRRAKWRAFWKDFNSENHWLFPDVSPSQLQELLRCPTLDHSERVRAEWMWRRRPKLVLGEGFLGYCLVLTVGLLLPLVHQIGLLLDMIWLFISSLLIASDTVRAMRWS